MRIIIFLSMIPEEGGKFQYSVSLLEDLVALKENNFEVIALYLHDLWVPYLEKFSIKGYKISLSESWLYKKLRTIIFVKFSFIKIWRLFNKLFSKRYKQIKKHKPLVIFYPGSDSFSSEFDFPFVIPIFDLMHRYENFPEVKEPVVYKSREMHYKNICSLAEGLLVDSEVGKQHVLDCYKVDEKKIFIYPYRASYYVNDFKEVGVIKKYNLPNDFFFYPAQFWEHKNHKVIIEAAKILKEKGEIIYFVFVGSKKNGYDKVIELINNYGLQKQFFILGYVTNDELVSLYKKAKALVFPSFFGPTNIPPLEALALGCPVIVSDIYAHREQLTNKVTYFNPSDPKDLVINLYARRQHLNKINFHNNFPDIYSKIIKNSIAS